MKKKVKGKSRKGNSKEEVQEGGMPKVLNVKRDWPLYVVFVFLLGRLFLNLDFILEFKLLSFSFAVIYLFLVAMLLYGARIFSTLFILFLTIDSMIGTYLFAMGSLGNMEFYGTMLINIVIMILILEGAHSRFLRFKSDKE